MGRNLVIFMFWFRLALVGVGAILLLSLSWIEPLADWMSPLGERAPGVDGVFLASGLSLVLLVAACAALTLFWVKHPEKHRHVVIWVDKALDGLAVGIMLVVAAELVSSVWPPAGGVASFLQLDRGFELLWTAWEDLGGRLSIPLSVAGFATGPMVVILVLMLARGELTRATKVLVAVPSRRGEEGDRKLEKAMASRTTILKAYADTRDLLERSRKDLCFLSLDIVGSTSMKVGEDPHIIEHSFREYRVLVEGFLAKHSAYKQTWTPDGQMAAFFTPQDAVECGKAILMALPEFNRRGSRMKGDFRLRVGINRGLVSIEDDTPLEEVSDLVIDVAGHMQKHADVDSIWMPEFVYRDLDDSTGFVPVDQQVDGYDVYAWRLEKNEPA